MSTKAHAQHNKELCELLLTQPKNFNDWVVTTAFYSALHFVQSKIFPYTDAKGATHQTIDEYLSYLKATSNQQETKHSATIKLVSKTLQSVRAEYRWLYDTCMTARYSHYKVQKSIATEAKESLLKIEAACA